MARFTIHDDKRIKISVLPIYRNGQGQPQIVSTKSPEGQAIVQTIVRLSRPLNTELQIEENEIVLMT